MERAVRVRALAGDTVLCSWARQLTLTVLFSTEEYKCVPVNCWGKSNKFLGNDLRWTSIPPRVSRNTPSCFMLQKPGISSGSYEPVGSKASFVKEMTELSVSFFLLLATALNSIKNRTQLEPIRKTLCHFSTNVFAACNTDIRTYHFAQSRKSLATDK